MQVKYKLTVFLCCLFTAFQTNANGKEPVDYEVPMKQST